MAPLLSIITATFNSEKTLEETIDSILNQQYTNFEYLIIDGKSTDNTLTIIKKYELIFKQKNISFKWVSETDTGIYNAWNKGLKLSVGNWIAFLGSDDVYLDNALETYAKEIALGESVDFIHSKVKLINKTKVKHVFADTWKWPQFKRYMKISQVGCFHNKNYFKTFGAYNEDYKITGDYELLLRAKSNLKTIFIDEFTAEMKDGGVSNKNVFKAFKEAKKAKINTAKIPKSIAFFDFYFSLFKYYLSTFVKMILK
jgi:glycosyltransferase involved in cell wall biosynthesis